MEVVINGVKYIPVKDVRVANARAIKLALLTKYWGDCSQDSDDELDRKWEGVYISSTDSPKCSSREEFEGRYFTIDELLDLITELS